MDTQKSSVKDLAALGTDTLLDRCEALARKLWPGNGDVWFNIVVSTDPEFPGVRAQLTLGHQVRADSEDLDCGQKTRQEALATILVELQELAIERFLSTYP